MIGFASESVEHVPGEVAGGEGPGRGRFHSGQRTVTAAAAGGIGGSGGGAQAAIENYG